MRARLLHWFKLIDAGGLEERVAWEVPVSRKYPQGIRYRLVFVRAGEKQPAVLYDNHHPKGHHRHVGGRQEPYAFEGFERLLEDFRKHVEQLKWKH